MRKSMPIWRNNNGIGGKTMSIRERLSGNEAVANAMRQINPDVVAAFPITPSTEVPQYFSAFVNDGKVSTEFVPVESEHSAMSACVGASAAGGRVMTATSANGLSYMWEILYINKTREWTGGCRKLTGTSCYMGEMA